VTEGYQLYWGDLHNHNELGYGQGSLSRSYEIATNHLDFYAFTPHAQFCDGNAPDGYAIVVDNWPKIQRAAVESNNPGQFSAILAYEWHSKRWGHYCIYYENDNQPLHFEMTLEGLVDYVRTQQAIMLPHHIGYRNGIDWELFDEQISPVVEIYSEHGCCERDGGPFPYLGHSTGPGGRPYHAQYGLSAGKKFGLIAGTDGHDGYPGGYGLGLTGVYARQNTREDIFAAIRARRTIAVTGDRIAVTLQANEATMGGVVKSDRPVDLIFSAEGWDTMRSVELVRSCAPVCQFVPPYERPRVAGVQAYRLRIEWGWGPMKGLLLYDWVGELTVEGGRLNTVFPCFRSDPFDEHRRKVLTERNDNCCRWQSYTSRGGPISSRNAGSSCGPTDALVVEVIGTVDTQIGIKLNCSTAQSIQSTATDWSVCNASGRGERFIKLGDLVEGGQGIDFARTTRTCAYVHRAIPAPLYRVSGSFRHEPSFGPAYYYVRASQDNGQMAWSSPIWIEP